MTIDAQYVRQLDGARNMSKTYIPIDGLEEEMSGDLLDGQAAEPLRGVALQQPCYEVLSLHGGQCHTHSTQR